MILCDVCGSERKVGQLYNALALKWINVLSDEGVGVGEYHLCSNCTKKLNDHLKKQVEKGRKNGEDNENTKA